jgi:hypothetical protein
LTPREEKFARPKALQLPEGSGTIKSMRAFGDKVLVVTDECRLFSVSPEGSVSEVTDPNASA